MNGIVPPSPNARAGLPKVAWRRLARARPASHGANAGAFQPGPGLAGVEASPWAPYGGSAVSAAPIAASAARRDRTSVAGGTTELQRRVRSQHVAGRLVGGMPSTPVTLSVGCQVWCQQLLGRVVDHRGRRRRRTGSASPIGELGRGRRRPGAGGRRGCRRAARRQQHLAGDAVLDAVEQLARRCGTTTARRRWPRRSARPRSGSSTRSVPPDQTAQRRRDPQPVVVEAAGVEAQHQARRADAGRRAPRGTPGRSGLPLSSLASISTTQRAWAPPAACAASMAAQRGERGVAVVGAAAAVEPIALDAPASTGRGRRASRSSPAACRGGRRAARCRRSGRRRRPGSP